MSVQIYSLSDPKTGECRYIGQSVNAKQRLNSHRLCVKRGSPLYVHNWWRKTVREQGMEPLQEIMVTVETTEQADMAEQILIEGGRLQGLDLTNISGGGHVNRRGQASSFKGKHHTQESKRKLSEATANHLATHGHPNQGKHWKVKDSSRMGKSGFWTGRHHSEASKQKIRDYWKSRREIPNA